MYWQRASERADMRMVGMGPHRLRSAFESECGRLGVKDVIAEFIMGHGGGDKYGYRREVTDESYVGSELSKLWRRTRAATAVELDEVREQIRKLDERISEDKTVVGVVTAQDLKMMRTLLDLLRRQRNVTN